MNAPLAQLTELLSPAEVAALGKWHVRTAHKLMRRKLGGFDTPMGLRCTRKAWEQWVRNATESSNAVASGISGRTQSLERKELLDAAARRQHVRTETSVNLQQQIRPTQPRSRRH